MNVWTLALFIFGAVGYSMAHGMNTSNLAEFCWNDSASSKAFCAIQIGEGTWLTVEHGVRHREKQLEKLGLKIIKTDASLDLALLARDKSNYSAIQLGKVNNKERVFFVVDDKKIYCEVLEMNPYMIIGRHYSSAGYSGKPIFNQKGELVGLLKGQIILKETGEETDMIFCVSSSDINLFLK